MPQVEVKNFVLVTGKALPATVTLDLVVNGQNVQSAFAGRTPIQALDGALHKIFGYRMESWSIQGPDPDAPEGTTLQSEVSVLMKKKGKIYQAPYPLEFDPERANLLEGVINAYLSALNQLESDIN